MEVQWERRGEGVWGCPPHAGESVTPPPPPPLPRDGARKPRVRAGEWRDSARWLGHGSSSH